ncbi:MAG: OmpA family protein [Prevotellaceae bacterium]|jgi:flagellar motor protein MotB|nr:OmpA family protein [Prevotellaceae bacterium]
MKKNNRLTVALGFIAVMLCSAQLCFAEFKISSLFQSKKSPRPANCAFHANNFYLPYTLNYLESEPVLSASILYDIDIDGDGIPNRFDDCPATFGIASRKGCPAFDLTKSITYGNPTVSLQKADFDMMVEIFSSLEFEGEQQLLTEKSLEHMNSLVKFLKKEKNLYLYISAYVNVGNNRMRNYYLSESRVQSVYNCLVKNGIESYRLGILFFGDMMPVVDLPATRFEVEICDKKKF